MKKNNSKNNPITLRKYFLTNKKRIYDKNRKWRKNNPEKIKKYATTYAVKYPIKVEEKNFRTKIFFLKKLDLSFSEFKKLLIKQNFLCALCKKPETLKHQSGTPRLLCIDHNHKTGAVRGLLCQKCNSGLGFFNDDIDLLEKAVLYLQKYGKK